MVSERARARPRRSRSRRDPQQRAAGQVEGAPRLLVARRRGLPSRAGSRQAARRSTDRQRRSQPGAITWTGCRSWTAKVVRSASCRRTISSSAALERATGRARRGAGQRRNVVGGAARLQLVEEPEPLLGEGERQVARLGAPARSGDGQPVPSAGGVSIAPASPRDRRRLEQPRSGSSTPKASRIRETTCVASSEWPPSSKKSSCDPDALEPQHLRPDARQHLLHGRARRHVALAAAPGDQLRGRQGARSTLPLAVSGSASSTTKADGTMYSGSRSREVAAQLGHELRGEPAPQRVVGVAGPRRVSGIAPARPAPSAGTTPERRPRTARPASGGPSPSSTS